ncbi:conserved hypothetical protein [Hyphomicrobiales bacterium]|jgi:hypothetical protein|nr:hypothetical protein [Pseudomonadota bacterium]CAH1696390.1 conserved hypothetical protein [Hyphomicrobiales bacterium]CAH1696525.1 conserved hypothetical protein [Hyphomicrobiales bacterium]
MTEKSKQRRDADKAFLKLQAPEKTGDRAPSASQIADRARDANTARLRELRLQKEAQERKAAPSPNPKAGKDRKPD